MKRSHENPSLDKNNNESGASAPKRDENGFLGRWSRRKRNAEVLEQEVPEALVAETPDANVLSPTQDNPSQHTDEMSAEEGPPLLTDADMPDIETLNADSDFSPFFSEGVSKELRNLALSDGLDDYDDDFTKFEPLGDTVTSDMKFHARRKEKARLAEIEEQRLLQESEEASATEDSKEVATTDSNTDENSVADKSEQELADSCEPEVITSDHSEHASESVEENSEPVALEDLDNTVRTPKG